jgi:hypothetical protein
VSFKLETTEDFDDNRENLRPNESKLCEDSQKFIDYFEEYCEDILKTRRDMFVDLKDFKEQV